MEVLILLVFVSLVLASSAVVFFAWNVKQHDHEHADRLTLLPLHDDTAGAPDLAAGAKETNEETA